LGGGVYRSRLSKPLDEDAFHYLSSLSEDAEIFLEDILGTEAHVVMLYEQGLLSRLEVSKILSAIERLRSLWIDGKLSLEGEYEDVHEFIEAFILKEAGIEVGGKVHTGRSRNDQVALDMRLRVRGYLLEIWRLLLDLAETLLSRAEEEQGTIMVLYTHLQHAQIGYLSHYFLAHLDQLLRDLERLKSCYRRVNRSPLGASAIGGSILPLNRLRVAELLGFEGIIENSVDAVSSRDFVLEAASVSAILMAHLSRIAEDLVVWSSTEFGYVELPDELASPSSIMPQKKNPCILELLRARAGKVFGLLTSLLSIVKGVPTGYNRDLQESKPSLWEILKTTRDSLKILGKVFKGMTVKRERLLEAASKSYAPAVDLAELLIKHSGLSLREAHRVVGELVRRFTEEGRSLRSLDPETLRNISQQVLGRAISLPENTLNILKDVSRIPLERATRGSPNPKEIKRMIEERRRVLDEAEAELKSEVKKIREREEKLKEIISKLISK